MGHHHDEAEDEQIPFWLKGAGGSGHRVVVTAEKRQWLDDHLERQWRRPPTPAESERSVTDFIREEILYREALVHGFDRNDIVVRRRLVQKMEMLALRDGQGIGESDLMDHYLAHRADYATPETVSFTHVFFSTAVRGTAARESAEAALSTLDEAPEAVTDEMGDPSPTPTEVTDWTLPMVEGRFGTTFAASIVAVEPGRWAGPIESAYGSHLVMVRRHEAARVPEFDEVTERIAIELDTARRETALDRLYADAREAYAVEFEPTSDEAPATDPPHQSHQDLPGHQDRHSHHERIRA